MKHINATLLAGVLACASFATDTGMPVQAALEFGRAAGMTSAESHVRAQLEGVQSP